ncbi:helix-turn-helix transcriptional regulator [Microvirga rosea]|uniref:helix-turn-helix transcriptional regulator n=1 Tax=Microvirga rosea TaxID=2715425 RepID=UPI001D0B25AA|nr:helix-turn-helix transcriptional regulator [Microvirga rosea]MCB8820122.1 helix-turn-helix transcriptional regulator [Microvirga rosea]
MLVSAVPVSATEADQSYDRRRELAAFLKRKRALLSPEDMGFPRSPRRRVKGLLREEVAQRAGVSLTWYTWLEQAREIQASVDLVERLAKALLLNDAERRHLRLLSDPQWREMAVTESAPASLATWIRGLDPQPAYALNGLWNIIAWNEAACALLGDFSAVPAEERNLMRLLFLDAGWRSLFVDWDDIAAASVAQFRIAAAQAPRRAVQQLIDTLSSNSSTFARLWAEGAVGGPEIRVKRLRHPRHGAIALGFASVRPEGSGEDISVTIYAQPVAGDATETGVNRS